MAALLIEQGKTVAAAESCTGGLLARRLTDIPGSSAYFLRGYVAYSNQAKVELLGVDPGSDCPAWGRQRGGRPAMAVGCRSAGGVDFARHYRHCRADRWHSPERPVGLVYVALAGRRGCPSSTVPDGRTPLPRRNPRSRRQVGAEHAPAALCSTMSLTNIAREKSTNLLSTLGSGVLRSGGERNRPDAVQSVPRPDVV